MNYQQKTFKVVLLGDGSVGKTSLRHQYLGLGFNSRSSMTIGADFAVKRVKDKTIQIWDLAGQARFKSVREVYYQGAVGAIIVFDVTRKKTFKAVPKWLKELLINNKDEIIPIILVGNKVDLRQTNHVQREEGEQYAKSLTEWAGFPIPYIETSAKIDLNVDKVFATLISNMVNNK